MPSTMAWLDTSAEQQRRARELVQLFADTESRDELGIGQIRDVYSNRLFPGTSVIQTRARYFLFVPWLFRLHEARGRSGADLLRRVQAAERQLITTMKATPGIDIEGLIGSRAGASVKILPSAVYWSGLTRYGVLTRPLAPDDLGMSYDADLDEGAADERTGRRSTSWHPTIPDPPPGFPDAVHDGFKLTAEEATWFKEVILESEPSTLLCHLLTADEPPSALGGPWEDPIARHAEPAILAVLDTAEVFSLVFHGAALLYNLLLAEAYEAAGHGRARDPVADFTARLDEWAEKVEVQRSAIQAWDVDAWLGDVLSFNPGIGLGTRQFATAWVQLVRSMPSEGVAGQRRARELVAHRERLHKKAQARLQNERLLRNWNGASGADRMTYRWPTVRRLVSDVITALD